MNVGAKRHSGVFGMIMLKERRSLRGSQRPVLAIGGHWISLLAFRL